MYKYYVKDETIIDSKVENVFEAIIDCYDGENNWWMPYLSSKKLSDISSSKKGGICMVTIHSSLPIKFITRCEEVIINEKLKLSYPKGVFKGEGIWAFEKYGNKTRLSFHWQTNPSGFFMKTLSLIYPLQKAHSAIMHKGFKKLKRLLEEKN